MTQDKNQLAFILALIGGLFSLGSSLMMLLFLGAFLTFAPMEAMVPFFGIILGWLTLGGIIGGIIMLVAAPRLRRPADAQGATTLAIVGGAIALVGGNMIAGALGIAAGVILLSDKSRGS